MGVFAAHSLQTLNVAKDTITCAEYSMKTTPVASLIYHKNKVHHWVYSQLVPKANLTLKPTLMLILLLLLLLLLLMSSSFQLELQRSSTVLCLACRHAFPPAVAGYTNPCPNPNVNPNELGWGRVDCHPTDEH